MNILHFNTLHSTHTYVSEHAASMAAGTVVSADYQTAGRGQRGNTWEAEAGENLLFSMLVRPAGLAAGKQFYVSEAVSLALVDTLWQVCGVECRIKWPNDIYAGEKKICGILIAHGVEACEEGEARITHSVLSAGVNLNQKRFVSDAPNPVSVFQLTGVMTDRELFLQQLLANIEAGMELLNSGENATLHDRYMSSLWRGDGGVYPFYDVQTGERFRASVYAVEPLGHLVLRSVPEGTLRRYAFKEVSWL